LVKVGLNARSNVTSICLNNQIFEGEKSDRGFAEGQWIFKKSSSADIRTCHSPPLKGLTLENFNKYMPLLNQILPTLTKSNSAFKATLTKKSAQR